MSDNDTEKKFLVWVPRVIFTEVLVEAPDGRSAFIAAWNDEGKATGRKEEGILGQPTQMYGFDIQDKRPVSAQTEWGDDSSFLDEYGETYPNDLDPDFDGEGVG